MSRTLSQAPGPAVEPRPPGIVAAAAAWSFGCCSAGPLRLLCTGTAAVLLFKQLSVAPYLDELFSRNGLVPPEVADRVMGLPFVPRAWWVGEVVPGWASAWGLRALFLAFIGSTAMMLAGLAPRVSALTTWLLHTCFLAGGFAHAYGADFFIQTYLFFIVLMQFSAGGAAAGPELFLHRMLQAFLALVYGTSGLAKAFPAVFVNAAADPSQWWSGIAMTRSLLRPDLGQFDFSWLPFHMWLARSVCYGTLATEALLPLLLLWRRTRRPAVIALVVMHVGIGVCMGLHAFAAIQVVALTAGFLVPLKPDDSRPRPNWCRPWRFPPLDRVLRQKIWSQMRRRVACK